MVQTTIFEALTRVRCCGLTSSHSPQKEAVGKVVLRMAWQNPLETPRPQRAAFDPARPGTAGDAAGGGLSDIRARLQGAGAQGARYTGGDSLDEAHFGRAAQPAAGLPRGTRDPQARARNRPLLHRTPRTLASASLGVFRP